MRAKTLTLISILLFSLLPGNASADKYESTILWRVEGNGLTKPSYLFGTIHLTNKELFYLGDSVYAAIEKVEGFANELDMNELAVYYINEVFDRLSEEKFLDDELSDYEKEEYGDLLTKKFKKPLKDISYKDIIKEKNKWLTDYVKKGKMETILDVHLYNIATAKGKWTGGIEDIEDQMKDVSSYDIQNVVVSERISTLRDIIEMYKNQDINAIDTFFNANDSSSSVRSVIKRNYKMARRIDSLARIRSMFFAVGTAHLPGEEGLIDQLREKGFTVTPVISSKIISPDDYKFTPVEPEWVTIIDNDSFYSVNMPVQTTNVKLFGMIDVNCAFDITKMQVFYSMAVPINNNLNTDSLYEAVAKNTFSKTDVKKGKKVSVGDVRGKEYFGTRDSYSARVQYFKHKGILMCFFMISLKEDVLKSGIADKFFKSVQFNTVQPKNLQIQTFSDSLMALSFETPIMPEYNKVLSDAINKSGDWSIDYYTGIDKINGYTLFLLHKKPLPGYYIEADSTGHIDFKETMYAGAKDVKEEKITINGYNGYSFTGKSLQYGYMKIYSIYRGNAHVIMVFSTDSAKMQEPSVQNIFKSLRFFDYKKSTWTLEHDSLKTFSTMAPAPIKLDIDSSWYTTEVSYYSFDENNYTTYYILTDTLTPYTYISDVKKFLKKSIEDYINIEKDSIISSKINATANPATATYLVKQAGSETHIRIKAVLVTDVLYMLCAYGGKKEITNEHSSGFFNSFKSYHKSTANPFISKTKLVLKDIKSSDSLTRLNAYNSISDLNIDDKEVEQLNKALFQKYDSVYYGGQYTINKELGEKLGEVGNTSTIAYIRKEYAKVSKTSPELAGVALSTLASMKTKESFSCLVELMQMNQNVKLNEYYFQRSLEDSLELTKLFYKDLSKLIADTFWGTSVAQLTITLLDSNMINKEDILPFEKDVIAYAKSLRTNSDTNILTYSYTYIADLLSRMNTPAADSAISTFFTAKNRYLARKSAMLLAKKDKPVPASIWERIAADIESRKDLYDDLKKENKTNLIPKEYLNQKELSIARMYDYLYLIDEYPDSITLISSVNITADKKKYTLYMYEIVYSYDEDTSSYLVVEGAYSSGNALDPETEFYETYWEEEYIPELKKYYQNVIEGDFRKHLKQKEEEDTDDKE